ncbi:hypothetical protein PTI98_007049 [Pleurotus ostreatus]|nr:hypothetical protein PTI98_007049 [Pleurotus ostreatus]
MDLAHQRHLSQFKESRDCSPPREKQEIEDNSCPGFERQWALYKPRCQFDDTHVLAQLAGYRALVEENVKANVQRIHKSKAATGYKGQKTSIYGWVYDIATGDIKDLGVTVSFGK